MSAYADVEWQRATEALRIARDWADDSPDASASRAYYAAFHAITALFAIRGRMFRRHAALRAAVHRDLVQGGEWPERLGEDFDLLLQLRQTGDYGGLQRVDRGNAAAAIKAAERIIEAVRQSCPELQ